MGSAHDSILLKSSREVSETDEYGVKGQVTNALGVGQHYSDIQIIYVFRHHRITGWTLSGGRITLRSAMSAFTLTVNGRTHNLDVDPATPLLYVLGYELRLNCPKLGCGLGHCGACTVILNDQATLSCT